MSTTVVKPAEFEKAVTKALAQYGDKVTETMETVTKTVARDSVKALKASAPAGGRYAKGWSHKAQKGGAYKLSETVYNRTDGQLTHLLEKPHKTGGGKHPQGHYPTHVDYTGTMARVDEEYENKYVNEVMKRL